MFDKERVAESAESLWGLLEGQGPPEGCILLVLGNKADRPATMALDSLRESLRLSEAAQRFKAVEAFKVSLYSGEGYKEALGWLERNL